MPGIVVVVGTAGCAGGDAEAVEEGGGRLSMDERGAIVDTVGVPTAPGERDAAVGPAPDTARGRELSGSEGAGTDGVTTDGAGTDGVGTDGAATDRVDTDGDNEDSESGSTARTAGAVDGATLLDSSPDSKAPAPESSTGWSGCAEP